MLAGERGALSGNGVGQDISPGDGVRDNSPILCRTASDKPRHRVKRGIHSLVTCVLFRLRGHKLGCDWLIAIVGVFSTL